MVILIASDKTRVRRGLADRLREMTDHRVLTAASVAEMETIPGMEGALDLLVFSPVFSEPGKEARERLRVRFPALQTVVLDDKTPLEQSVANLMNWVGATPPGQEPAAEAGVEGDAQSGEDGLSVEGEQTIGKNPAGNDPAARGVPSWHEEALEPSFDAGPGEAGFNDDNSGADLPAGQEEQGDYELRELMRSTESTLIYKAVQRSVRRTVALECLRPELAADSAAAKRFRQLVRARALVSHPVIAAVYEAKETEESIFHTYELLPGENLPDLAAAGRQFPQTTLLALLQAGADAMVWMDEHGIPHEPLRPEHFFLSPNGPPRILNPASHHASAEDSTPGSLAQLAAICQRLSEPRSTQTKELAHVIGLMRSPGAHGVHSWKSLAREARNSLQRLSEAHTALTPENPDRLLARRRHRRSYFGWALVAAALLALLGWGTAWWRRAARAKVRDLSGMVKVSAGSFVFRDGQKVELPDFWIDRHEVTLWEYSQFLAALPQGLPTRYDHPDQPVSKSGHDPKDWAGIHKAAQNAGSWLGHPLTLNSPVFNVDWWDAWAFAAWKGCRLPTEQEWEKAARGSDGRLWPWGMEMVSGKANIGGDGSGQGGTADGHSWWCDADAMPGDVSPSGVIGLAGNVAEWTSTLVPDPDFPDLEVPVFRGGDFHQTVPVPLNAGPRLAKDALYAQPFLGFRTASSKETP